MNNVDFKELKQKDDVENVKVKFHPSAIIKEINTNQKHDVKFTKSKISSSTCLESKLDTDSYE